MLLCEKVLNASLAAAMACRVSISSAIVTLPITVLLVGFTSRMLKKIVGEGS